MITATHPKGELIGKLLGFKSPQGDQVHGVELTWIPQQKSGARRAGG